MEVDLDTPEFNHMLGILFNDLISSDKTDISEACVSYDNKTYLLTSVPKNSTFRDPSYNSSIISKKKLKNKFIKALHKTKLARPRIVKTDVRASVPDMLTNVMNTVNFSSILSLLQTFCMPDMPFRLKKPHPESGKWLAVDICGPLNIANVIFANMTIFPDCTSSLLSARFDPSCGIVICDIQMEMTKVFNVSSIHDFLPKMLVESSHVAKSSADEAVNVTPSQETLSGDQIASALETLTSSLPLRRKPVHIVHRFKYVMVTNSHKRMTEVKVTQYVVKNDFSVEV